MRGPRGRLVLAEAPLETIPRELWGHPSVYKYARRRGKPPRSLLLDSSVHHQAMRGLRDRERRGRPDVVHATLLCVLESPAVREGLVEVIIHTYGDYVIEVDPATRLPRNYQRFVGLIEQLFEQGRVPPGSDKPLLTIRPGSLASLVDGEAVILDQEGGEPAALLELARRLLGGATVIIPLVPGGGAGAASRLVAGRRVALRRRLEPWVAAGHLAAAVAIEAGLV